MAKTPAELVEFEARGDVLVARPRAAAVMGEEGRVIGDAIIDEVQSLGGTVRLVAFDMTGVSSVNSVLLGSLVTVKATLMRYNVDLVLVGVPGAIRELLTVTRLDRVFTLLDRLADAGA